MRAYASCTRSSGSRPATSIARPRCPTGSAGARARRTRRGRPTGCAAPGRRRLPHPIRPRRPRPRRRCSSSLSPRCVRHRRRRPRRADPACRVHSAARAPSRASATESPIAGCRNPRKEFSGIRVIDRPRLRLMVRRHCPLRSRRSPRARRHEDPERLESPRKQRYSGRGFSAPELSRESAAVASWGCNGRTDFPELRAASGAATARA